MPSKHNKLFSHKISESDRSNLMTNYPIKTKLNIDWTDIDLFGHVNNVAILKYVQSARVNYLEHIGLMQLQSETKMGPILASVSCQFRKSLYYPGQVTIYSKVDSINNTSFRMQHLIYDRDNNISAEAEDILVFFDFHNNTKLSITNEIREKIEALENKDL